MATTSLINSPYAILPTPALAGGARGVTDALRTEKNPYFFLCDCVSQWLDFVTSVIKTVLPKIDSAWQGCRRRASEFSRPAPTILDGRGARPG